MHTPEPKKFTSKITKALLFYIKNKTKTKQKNSYKGVSKIWKVLALQKNCQWCVSTQFLDGRQNEKKRFENDNEKSTKGLKTILRRKKRFQCKNSKARSIIAFPSKIRDLIKEDRNVKTLP